MFNIIGNWNIEENNLCDMYICIIDILLFLLYEKCIITHNYDDDDAF
jgi:hypothetical protein